MGDVKFTALKGIDLHITKGEFVVILGPSGSGKNTMMNLLVCLDLCCRADGSFGKQFSDHKGMQVFPEHILCCLIMMNFP